MVIDADDENVVKIKTSVFVTYIAFYYMRLDEASSGKLQSAIPFSETTSSTNPMAPTPLSPSKHRKSVSLAKNESREICYH